MRFPLGVTLGMAVCAASFGCTQQSAEPDEGVIVIDMAASVEADAATHDDMDAATRTVSVGSDVTITNACDTTTNPDAGTIVYGGAAKNEFLGYGANVLLPGQASTMTSALDAYEALALTWARFDYGNPFRENTTTNVAVPTGTTAQIYQTVYSTMSTWVTTNQTTKQTYTLANSPTVLFYQQLKARKIKIVSTIFEIPESYRTGSTNDWKIDTTTIPNFAQFYVAYYLSLVALGIPPDYLELVNEPDGNWEQQFAPADYVTFVDDVELGLADCQSYDPQLTLPCPTVGILGPGTSNIHPAGKFLDAMVQSTAKLTQFAALSTHTYLLPPNWAEGVNTIYNSTSPVYDPVYAQLVSAAQAASKDLIMTEFGGRTSLDVSSPSDPTLLLKDALDLIRLGASAALIWDLFDGEASDPYALVSSGTPTSLYYPIQALVPNIPAGAKVLQTSSTNGELMSSLGFGAFASGSKLLFGLANPSQDPVQVTVDLADADGFSLDTAYGYTPSSVLTVPVGLARTTCPITFNLGAYAGVVVAGHVGQ